MDTEAKKEDLSVNEGGGRLFLYWCTFLNAGCAFMFLQLFGVLVRKL